MQPRISFTNNALHIINSTFESREERILIILQQSDTKAIHERDIIIPERNNYRFSEKKKVSLKPEFLAKAINTCLKSKYYGIIILHNHVNHLFPLFSATDRQNHFNLSRFLSEKAADFHCATGVYANGILSIKTNNIAKYQLYYTKRRILREKNNPQIQTFLNP